MIIVALTHTHTHTGAQKSIIFSFIQLEKDRLKGFKGPPCVAGGAQPCF